MENEVKPMSTKELTSAVSLLLEREETRQVVLDMQVQNDGQRQKSFYDRVCQITGFLLGAEVAIAISIWAMNWSSAAASGDYFEFPLYGRVRMTNRR